MRCAAVLVAILAATPSWAAAPSTITIEVQGSCPEAERFAASLGGLLPTSRVELLRGRGQPTVRVLDEGAAFRVRAAGEDRRFEDAGRSCGERARAAAVVAALLLDPPVVAQPEPEPAPAPAPTPPVPSSPAVPSPAPAAAGAVARTWELEARGRFHLGPSIGSSANRALFLEAGGELRASLSFRLGQRTLVGPVLGLGVAASPASVSATGVSGEVRLLRLPLDVGVRAAAVWERIELGGELSLLLAWQRGSGENFTSVTSTFLATPDVGLRAAVDVRARIHRRVALVLAPSLELLPATHELQVTRLDDSGRVTVERTPRLWLGASLGVAVRLD